MRAPTAERPVIGVTAGHPNVDPGAADESTTFDRVLRGEYVRAIEGAGGVPVLIFATLGEGGRELLPRLDGLLLTGGADVDPARYGEERFDATVVPNPPRDAMESALIAESDRLDLPVLGICRGIQILNVTRGGTLWQDLPAQRPRGLAHAQPDDGTARSHEVDVPAESRLRRIIDADRLSVNSHHHQAIRSLGEGLTAVAISPDDLVEAVEDPRRSFLLGVQWHPERMQDVAAQRAIVSTFVDAARRWRRGRAI